MLVMSKTNSKAKKKLCWNCEGSVSIKEDNCPLCGVYIGADLDRDDSKHRDFDEDLEPPYDPSLMQDQTIPDSPYVSQNLTQDLDNTTDQSKEPIDQEKVSGDFKQLIMSLGLLMGGSVFFLFGFAVFLFAKHGVFTLQWNATYWIAYLLIGLILGFWGWRRLQAIEETP